MTTLSERFWSKVDLFFGITDEDCWNWTGSISGKGRARMFHVGRNRQASHIAWLLKYGIEPNLFMLHKCDNGLCVNPNHLFEGTLKDNADDMIQKGRKASTKGILNGRARLTPREVLQIKNAPHTYGICTRLGLKFSVNHATISRIRNGKAWC